MFKKGLAAIACLVVMTAAWSWAATTFQLQTKLSNVGGTLKVRNNATQTAVGTVAYANFTTSAAIPVTVTANAGYTITGLTKSGVAQTITNPATTVNVVKVGTTAQSVVATFAAQQVAVTGAVVGAGTISPATATVAYNGTVVLSSSPSNGNSILAAVSAGVVKDLSGNVVTLPYAGPVKITVSNVTAPVTVTATYTTVSVNAGQNQVAPTATKFTLKGTITGGGTPLWSQVSGPESVTINSAATLKADFTTATAGVYVFKLTESLRGNSSPTQVTLTADVNAYMGSACDGCHNATNGVYPSTAYNLWATSVHASNNKVNCVSCHTDGQMPTPVNTNTVNGANMLVTNASAGVVGTVFCAKCHTGSYPIPHPTNLNAGITCEGCHTDPLGQGNGTGGPHGIQALPKCIECHAVQQAQVAPGLVNDNNGVRAITTEFVKWSHHVTGVALQDAHCAACHLEGKASNGEIVVDSTKHMVNGITHLRNATTDADMQWDPAAPNHTTMDNFCMSCHSATGFSAPSAAAIQAIMVPAAGKIASASNPFGDTISNRYDKMQRPAVVDASSQFDTTNNSHHAVKGARYSGRTRDLAGPRTIASPTTFANNSSALLQGKRSTIYDAGNFNQLYIPLANNGGETAPRTGAATLGDDSTLHCGDCHTVGQYKVGSTVNAAGVANTVAIGAHGSNNEYLLRNSIGTDARHTQNAYLVGNSTSTAVHAKDPATGLDIPNGVVLATNPNGAYLVCYNCHAFQKYGSAIAGTGPNGTHAGEYATGGKCNGAGNTIPFNGYTTGAGTDGFVTRFGGSVGNTAANINTPTALKYTDPAAYNGEQVADFGNAFGIQCSNCHNSGLGNAYGGIHGSANNTNTNLATVATSVLGGAYIDGMGNTNKVERFLPGLGNVMFVPGTLGGFTGGTVAGPVTNSTFVYTYTTGAISNDTNWEQKHWNQTATTVITYKRDANGNAVAGGTVSAGSTIARAGAGCYTFAKDSQANIDASAANQIIAPSVDGAGGAVAEGGLDTWGGCDDHGGAQGKGDHGFVKQIVRPITY